MARNGNEKTLTPKQRGAIAALLTEPSVSRAAKVTGIGERTLHRWLKEDGAFIAELRTAEATLDAETMRRLATIQAKALDAIEQALDSPDASHSERLRAAEMVLAQRAKLRELNDIEERLSALEAMTDAQQL